MKLMQVLALSVSAFLFVSGAHARSTVPVVEREISWTAADGKSVDAETLRKAIISAGQKRQWDMVPSADGKSIKGSYSWNRNKHTILLDIRPSATGYSFKYLDSVNMKYGIESDVPHIHPHYNKLVEELIQSVRVELQKR